MADIEKVFKGLECCRIEDNCDDCPYGRGTIDPVECMGNLLTDALELLKEQDKTIKRLIETGNKLADHIKNIKEYMTPIGRVEDVKEFVESRQEVVRCKDCKWYDERISLCDNCGLPREQTFFCKDGKRRTDDA